MATKFTPINSNTAREILASITMHGTAAAAAHQCSVQLTAIRPYGDARLERLRETLCQLADYQERKGDISKQLAQITAIAEKGGR